MDHREWVLLAENLFMQAKNGSLPKVEGWLSEQEQSKEQFPFFAANMVNIGSLGPIAGPLAKFYTRVIGIRQTVVNMQSGYYDSIGPSGVAEVIRREIDLWHETAVLGRKLVRDLLRVRFDATKAPGANLCYSEFSPKLATITFHRYDAKRV